MESVGEITDLFTDCCHGLFWPRKILAASLFRPMDLWLEVSILECAPPAINKFPDNPWRTGQLKTHLSYSAVDEVVLEVPDQGVTPG